MLKTLRVILWSLTVTGAALSVACSSSGGSDDSQPAPPATGEPVSAQSTALGKIRRRRERPNRLRVRERPHSRVDLHGRLCDELAPGARACAAAHVGSWLGRRARHYGSLGR